MNIKTLITIAFVLASAIFFSSCKSDQEKIDFFIESFNKQCPINQGGVILHSAERQGKKTIFINMSFVKEIDLNDELLKKTIVDEFRKVYLQMLREDKGFRGIKNADATIIISIIANDEEIYTNIIITPSDYSKKSNKFDVNYLKVDTEFLLAAMTENIRSELPEYDKESGIKTIDCYSEGLTMTTVCVLPDQFIEKTLAELGDTSFIDAYKVNMMHMILNDDPIKSLVNYGVSIRYIYLDEDSNTFADITVNPDEVEEFIKLNKHTQHEN